MSSHPIGSDASLRAAWRNRDDLLYAPPRSVPDDAEEPWALCLLDVLPPPRTYAPSPVRLLETRAGRRTWKQRLKASVPRWDWRGAR